MSQVLQMAGMMMKAASWMAKKMARGVEIALTPVTQAAERLIPQGASELGAALYSQSNAYSPPGVTEATLAQAPTPVQAPAPQPAQTKTVTETPKQSFDEHLKQKAASMPTQAATQTRGRRL